MNVELVVDAQATVGEGAIWDARSRRLLWVDIRNGNIHLHDPAGQTDQVVPVGQMLGAAVPRRDGGLVLAMHHGFAHFDVDTGRLTTIADPERHLPGNRFNDGRCDPAGRFWAGTMSINRESEAGSLYCLDTDYTVRRVLEGVTCSNGIAWSLDSSTMYYVDTPTQRVDAFDYDRDTGRIGGRRTIITVPEQLGHPDGMTIDADGNLWIAMWNGGCVTQWDPRRGALLQTIRMPALHITSCAFGGEHLGDLYVTTARFGMTKAALDQQPHAGGLFCLRGAGRGVEAYEFVGGRIPSEPITLSRSTTPRLRQLRPSTA
jgi:sugar lactone lactonase YvrE